MAKNTKKTDKVEKPVKAKVVKEKKAEAASKPANQ